MSEKLRLMERVEKVTGISMGIRYKNQEPLILAMKMRMRSIGWSGYFEVLRIFAVSGWGDIVAYSTSYEIIF